MPWAENLFHGLSLCQTTTRECLLTNPGVALSLMSFRVFRSRNRGIQNKKQKGLVTYNKVHGTTAMRIYVESEHVELSSREISVHCMSVHNTSKNKPTKKQNHPTLGSILSFFL